MRPNARARKQLEQQLAAARSYEQWRDAATALDDMDGLLAWRERGETDMLHESLMREHMDVMARCRQSRDMRRLIRVLQESLYRHLGELSNPDLYAIARTGTKRLVSEFLDEVETSMTFICDHPIPEVTPDGKLQLFRDAERVYGRPALMLSGGAAFGVYHLGVTRALWRQDLLPDVMAGSSMGAIVAGAICCRDEAEVEAFFEHPERIHRQAFRWLGLMEALRAGHAMDPRQLHEHLLCNLGSASFREAFQRSGRILSISVSPTRTQQKPRLLNHLASPAVLVDSAVMASCAVPGIYPPVTLRAREPDGQHQGSVPYMPTESWIDGSVHGDLPLMRMARLHNVNKTIVSQANPHVVPFISHLHQRGIKARAKQAAVSVAHGQVATALKLTRQSPHPGILRPLLEQAHAMASQDYLGDINIHFPVRPALYRKVLSNPDPEDLEMFIRLGEQATWPRIAMIHDQTRISRAFDRCIRQLKAEVAQQNGA
ncbi:MAG: patatin-like phospholipase family protein [Marinobacter sp.]|uniref:patatin-like phospholipase family protein n=1 Tax=Marinobacter sp. TaxID=50741 RepID=UPI00299DBF4A|nr:patatin-like phospholipase family protein [Marinobacter sp.]MDX1635388.1 patatin-like phospholipase family protein [Marinobacter sp.]